MIPLLSTKKIKALEILKISTHIDKKYLQKKAVNGIFSFLKKDLEKYSEIVILIGPGSNGEDGILTGLKINKFFPEIKITYLSLLGKESSKKNKIMANNLGIKLEEIGNKNNILNTKKKNLLLIDAILGISSKLPLRKGLSEKLKFINRYKKRSGSTIISLDIPTGFDPESGELDKYCLLSDCILILGYQVPGTLNNSSKFRNKEYIDLGVTKKDLKITKSIVEAPQIITKDWSKLNYPIRSEVNHKKSFGSHLMIVGSDKYPGAALLCAKSSNLSGAGLTTVASTSKIIEKIIKDIPETTFLPLNNARDLDLIFSEKIGLYNSVSVGSGIDTNEYSKNIILNLLNYYRGSKNNQKLILDADGINILADFNYWWEDLPKSTILTPHLGEMEKISGLNKENLNLKKLIKITKKWNKTIVMKGPNTYISNPKKGVMINTCPNGGMSKPGIGDVLTGIIGSISSNSNLDVLTSSSLGVYIHSVAGELARNKFGPTSMTASNVISFIPQAFKSIEK